MPIVGFDHVAIPIARVDDMLVFYERLGFKVRRVSDSRFSVHFGDHKINFHGPAVWQSRDFTLKGPAARPGCGDFCFVWSGTRMSLTALLDRLAIPIEAGPVIRNGGRAGGTDGESVYLRDPDRNLLEFIIYPEPAR
ncbi:MAG: hypothetical protein GTO40_12910 [Deltaproteobacteria bacterium]|nr:hypothetical protein [Deltaproteobacteria bacterium]